MSSDTISGRQLILASTSAYRAELLARLQLPFDQVAPDCDETPLANETPSALVERLSVAKAASVAARHPEAVIIGSDQVADSNGTILGKPHTPERAKQQLRQMSGQMVVFRTGYSIQDGATGAQHNGISVTAVNFRPLTDDEIERYIEADKPLDCAGSFRSEALGISLLASMQNDDPSSIIGLPLIRVAEALRRCGITAP